MNINVIYGQGAANNAAPSGFYTAVNYVVNYYDTLFTNNVTININISYGSILDPYTNKYSNVSSGDLGESYENNENITNYTATRNALLSQSAPGASILPSSSPDPGSSLYMGSAEAKALGLTGASTVLDGAVGISSNTTWDYSATTTPTANQYYLVGTLEHEISEVMGRVSDLDTPGQYTVTDLYRYSSPGVRDFTTGGKGSTAYFSINNGTTNLGSWNNQVSNGDLADWYPQGPAPGGNDAYNDYSNSGVINGVSAADITLMQALGWTTAGGIGVTSITASVDNHTTIVSAGHLVTVTVTTSALATVTGVPTLQLNDNEVAGYTGGSGTNTLTFTYAVQPGDNVTDLQVTGLNLPSGATITNQTGNALAGIITGDLGLQINTTIVSPTSVQQEILGLYSALYNRATDFNGLTYWADTVGQQPDAPGVSVANAGTVAVTVNDATLLGQQFVNTQATYFNATYGSLTDTAFITALYANIGGNTTNIAAGVTYWANLLQAAEATESVQAARAGLVGQIVQDMVDYNVNVVAPGYTAAQWQAVVQRQATIDNKIAVSEALSIASQQAGGNILVVHTIGDAAFNASTAILQGITYDPATVTAAILGINNAVAHQNLSLI